MRRAFAAVVLAALAASAVAEDEKPAETPRRHKADPRALELVRKADRTTYRPTAAGLTSVRCTAEYVMTNGTRYLMAYVLEAPGKSTFAIRTSEKDEGDRFGEGPRHHALLDDLFDGPRLEKRLEPYELSIRETDAGLVVVADAAPDEKKPGASHVEFRFLPEGPVAEESPGEDAVKRGVGVRTRTTYEPRGTLFVRKRAVLDGYGKGSAAYQYEEVGGVAVPRKFGTFLSGLGGTLTISDVEVNVPVTGPATLAPPEGPPPQEALDALDVASLVRKMREPFVGGAPNPVTTLRIVRALAKKGDDAKSAALILVQSLGLPRGEKPKTDAPPDFEDFHVPAVKLLAELRPESIEPLVAALKSPITDQRYWAANALGRMGRDGAPATDALLAALDDKMWMVVVDASEALRRIGCPAERALPSLVRQADVWWMGEAFADEAIAFADADPDGDAKLAAALLAAPLKITREKDGRIRGVEHVLRKRGARLMPLLLEAKETEAVDAALLAMGAAARAPLEKFVASRPTEGEDAARDRAKALLERLPQK